MAVKRILIIAKALRGCLAVCGKIAHKTGKVFRICCQIRLKCRCRALYRCGFFLNLFRICAYVFQKRYH